MLWSGVSGIDCDECGYTAIVTTKKAEQGLMESLTWPDENCDPVCPECGALVTFESYIQDD